jgi:hypothetical protein
MASEHGITNCIAFLTEKISVEQLFYLSKFLEDRKLESIILIWMWPCNPQGFFMETKNAIRQNPVLLDLTKPFPSHTIRLIPRTVPQLREDVQTEKLI